jgi:para-aminobenzoate synthetase component 1
VTRELSADLDVPELLRALRGREGLVALDSAAGEPRRWSWVGFDPRRTLARDTLEFDELREWCARGPEADSVVGPFRGGFLGALSYDLGVAGEALRLPEDPWGTPRVLGGLYAEFFVLDHQAGRVWLVVGDDRSEEWVDALLSQLSRPLPPRAFSSTSSLRRLVDSATHQRRIQDARALIAAGEFYQANLAHPFEVETSGAPLDLYLRLRESNPAPYMGYLEGAEFALLSSSPELLLDVRGRSARTRPIKGTVERSADPRVDAERAEALLTSHKDRAELAMIVDLERNDLGRIAAAGSVSVAPFPELRSYENVHHLMADVVAELDAGRDALDALAALFPGGSITGAPKLRSMEAIAELEGEGRGYFTGSMGFVSCSGDLCFNILIRTLVWRAERERGELAGRVRYHVGGGITWGSDPAAEDRETLAKGARLAEALSERSMEVPR